MADKEIKRKIAVIFATDVVGYSKSIEIDEEKTIKNFRICKQILEDLFKEHGGRVFNTAGDSVLAEFSSAVSAVICASEFQKLIKERNDSETTKSKMEFRVGINMGDVVVENENLYGDGVNIATRLESLAQPNGICISKSVHEFINKKIDLLFHDLGDQTVKNNEFHAFDVILDASHERKVKTQTKSKVLLLAVIIGFLIIGVGNYFNFWDILSSQKNHVFYIGSLEREKTYVKDFSSIKDAIAENGEIEILPLNEQELDEISSNLKSNLINEFYNQNTHIEIISNEKDHSFVNSLSTDGEKYIDMTIGTGFYDYTNQPDQFGLIYIYKVENEDSINYLAKAYGWVGNPKKGNNWWSRFELENKNLFLSHLTEGLSDMVKNVNNKQDAGYVTQIDDNIIIINPNDLNLIKHMTVYGSTRYILKDNNENGKIDLDEGLKKLLDDINRAIEYAESHPVDYTDGMISVLHKMYQKWSNFNGTADMTMGFLFGYTLKVVDVTDSKVVAKILEVNHPWVKIREGDKITP